MSVARITEIKSVNKVSFLQTLSLRHAVTGHSQPATSAQVGLKFGFLFSITACSASLASGVDLMMEVA